MSFTHAPTPPSSPASPSLRRRSVTRRVWRAGGSCLIVCLSLLLACCYASLLIPLAGRLATAACASAAGDLVLAGAARADISPQQPVYLGGYGVGPVRRSTGLLQPLYARALVLRSADGLAAHTLVFASLDSQGYFAAYQSGPYGIDDMRATLAARLSIPVGNIVIASTHSHAAPDTVGFWGGVPDSYLARVYNQAIAAVTRAAESLVPARLSTGTASIAGLTSTFTGPGSPWPTDTQLRVLRATSPDGLHSIATLVNVSVHPTALGASNALAAPDWPGVTADRLEQTLGGTALVMIGALGHTWPGGVLPSGVARGSVAAMTTYGASIAQRALAAADSAQPIATPTLCAADRHFREAGTSAPLLLGLQTFGRTGHERILRSTRAPYFVQPDVLSVEVQALRIGEVAFFSAPVEPYPSLLFALRRRVRAGECFFLGLANDQLGYATMPGEYVDAVANSPSDEALFILNPGFGEDLVTQLVAGARAIGLPTQA